MNSTLISAEYASCCAGSAPTGSGRRSWATCAATLPDYARPRPDAKRSPQVLVRTDSAGATYGFAAACRQAGFGFSLGFAIDEPVREATLALPEKAWTPAYDIDGELREGALGRGTDRNGEPEQVAREPALPWL
jgi:hypothetical protein